MEFIQYKHLYAYPLLLKVLNSETVKIVDKNITLHFYTQKSVFSFYLLVIIFCYHKNITSTLRVFKIHTESMRV